MRKNTTKTEKAEGINKQDHEGKQEIPGRVVLLTEKIREGV